MLFLLSTFFHHIECAVSSSKTIEKNITKLIVSQKSQSRRELNIENSKYFHLRNDCRKVLVDGVGVPKHFDSPKIHELCVYLQRAAQFLYK